MVAPSPGLAFAEALAPAGSGLDAGGIVLTSGPNLAVVHGGEPIPPTHKERVARDAEVIARHRPKNPAEGAVDGNTITTMTTILACTTPEFVVLASDRAVSYDTASGIQGSPDRISNTVALYGQFIMGVTGFAELDALPVDEWVIETLTGVNPQNWPKTIASRATRSIGKIRKSSSHKHHAFVGVGFARIGPDPTSEWFPWRFVISNAYDTAGARLNQAASSFTVTFYPHPPDKWADLNSYGQTLPPRVNRWAERTLRKYQQRNEGAAQGCVELLGRLISGVSRRTSTVSTACLVSVLPKAAAGTGNIDVPVGTGSYVSKDAITCLNYIGTENQVIAYMPAAVSPGGSAIAKGGMFAPEGVLPPKPFENRPIR